MFAAANGPLRPSGKPSLRTALLAAVKRTPDGELRAQLSLAGKSVLSWQIDLVRALGCERILCLCESSGPGILEQQRSVELSGGEFHIVRGNLQIASLVRADDELIMLLDGLVPDRGCVSDHMRSGEAGEGLNKAILTIPAGHALTQAHAEDFERIDRDLHWSGMAAMRAAQVHKLADLPPDGDAMSLLLRLGLQGRTETRPVPAASLESGQWLLAETQSALSERENALITASAPQSSVTGPFIAAADAIVRKSAPRWIENASELSALAALVMLFSGAVLAGFGIAGWGLALAAIGAFAGSLSLSWSRIRSALWSLGFNNNREGMIGAGVDLFCAAALALASASGGAPFPQIALALLAIGLARLAGPPPAMNQSDWSITFWRDRGFHMAGFAIAAATGVLGEALSLFAIGALVQLMLRMRPK